MSEITRVFDLLELYRNRYIKPDVLAGKDRGKWAKYSSETFLEKVDLLSKGLLNHGIIAGDKVAVMSANRPEWNISDFAITQIGAVQVPMYPTLAVNDIRHILLDSGIRLIFVSNQELAVKLMNTIQDLTLDIKLYTFDDVEEMSSWHELIELGKQYSGEGLNVIRARVKPDDLLTLIYTSGTTGTPKGVMLTHRNLVSNFIASSTLYPVGFTKALSFLPLSHIFERMVIYMYLYLGISVYYAESMETIVVDINDVKPDVFTTVPRMLEKVFDKIVAKGTELTGIKKNLFFWALNLGLRYELKGVNGLWYSLQLWIARKLVFSKWRAALGGNIQAVVSGGAALQPRLARVFWAAGIPVLEGYGLTETSPVIAVNSLEDTKFTSVGKPIADVEVKIAADGEVLCKGPNVMKGYYKRPDLTAEVIDEDGWLHTGDIGELTPDGFLRITDRKKEIFKTAGGKYVAPQTLENKFKESPLIEQVIVIGENRKFACALIVPAFSVLKEWCDKKGISYTTPEEIIKNDQVCEKYKRELDRYNADFGRWEQVKRFELLPAEWSIENGELTPKLSLKRKVIFEKNKDLVEKIYRDADQF